MKQEFYLIAAVGLFLLAYLLDAVVNPLTLDLSTPYHFFVPSTLVTYPFTTASIFMKSLSIFILPIWFLSFLSLKRITKATIVLVISALLQLYALQDVALGSSVIPLEWALSFTSAGVALLIPALLYPLLGAAQGVKTGLLGDDDEEPYHNEHEHPSRPVKVKDSPKKFRL